VSLCNLHQVLETSQSVARTTAQLLRQGWSCPRSTAFPKGSCRLPRLHHHQHKQHQLCHELQQHLSKLEQARLVLRRDWLKIRVDVHNRLHDGSAAALMMQQAAQVNSEGGDSSVTRLQTRGVPAAEDNNQFWPTDSIHFFTFSYGASRVLNKMSGVAQTALDAWAGIMPAAAAR